MDDMYDVEHFYLDSSNKEERLGGGKVPRWVSFLTDLPAFIDYLREARQYHSKSRLLLKIGMYIGC